MAIFTLDQLRAELRYDKVIEERDSGVTQTGFVYSNRTFIVRPERDDLPAIHFIMDDTVSWIEALVIRSWQDETISVQDAIQLARQFINQELCLLEELDADKKLYSSGTSHPTEIPMTLHPNTKQFRRWFFGKEALTEPVDFSRYIFDETFQVICEKEYYAEVQRSKQRNVKLNKFYARKIKS